MTSPKLNRARLAGSLALVVALVVVGTFVWGFSRQLALARRMRVEEASLAQAVEDARSRNDDPKKQLEYNESDEYVEHWARVEAKMAKPGEVVVMLPSAGEGMPAEPQPTPSPEPQAQPFWVEWWKLVWGP